MAQWIAHWTSNPEVAGSSPVKSVYTFLISTIQMDEYSSTNVYNSIAAVAQWLVHLPCKEKVTSSNLVSGYLSQWGTSSIGRARR